MGAQGIHGRGTGGGPEEDVAQGHCRAKKAPQPKGPGICPWKPKPGHHTCKGTVAGLVQGSEAGEWLAVYKRVMEQGREWVVMGARPSQPTPGIICL